MAVELVGAQHNTFTGSTTVSGKDASINLIKNNEITAIAGNLNVRDGARVRLFHNEQIANHVRVSLSSPKGTDSRLRFNGEFQRDLKETIHELVVEGTGVIDFGSTDTDAQHSQRLLYLDDLIVENDSTLRILAWKDKRDYLLVRKSSAHLEDALKKLEFESYDPRNIHKEDYDADYWAISAAPEPTTYGAAIACVAIVFGATRLRRKHTLRLLDFLLSGIRRLGGVSLPAA